MTISDFTMRFFKNGQEVRKANGEDIIDVEIEGTFQTTSPNVDKQEKEIKNFDLNMADIEFLNASYVDGSLTNAIGTTLPTIDPPDFLKSWDYNGPGGVRRSLTHKIKFKIKLAKAYNFTERSARLNVTGVGFIFNINGESADTNKFFYIKIKPKINKWVAGAVTAAGILAVATNGENKNSVSTVEKND